MNGKKDWTAWHEKYDDPSSDLNERLKIVQSQIQKILPENPENMFQILDICAGDGRDLIPVLRDYAHNKFVGARLIEIDQELSETAKSAVADARLEKIEVVSGDASLTDSYLGIVPADMILLCGVFGNINDEDVEKIISALPEFCKQGGKVIWTRNRREPDITPRIRQIFSENGFSEVDCIASENNTYAVGVHKHTQQPLPYTGNRSLFTFIR